MRMAYRVPMKKISLSKSEKPNHNNTKRVGIVCIIRGIYLKTTIHLYWQLHAETTYLTCLFIWRNCPIVQNIIEMCVTVRIICTFRNRDSFKYIPVNVLHLWFQVTEFSFTATFPFLETPQFHTGILYIQQTLYQISTTMYDLIIDSTPQELRTCFALRFIS